MMSNMTAVANSPSGKTMSIGWMPCPNARARLLMAYPPRVHPEVLRRTATHRRTRTSRHETKMTTPVPGGRVALDARYRLDGRRRPATPRTIRMFEGPAGAWHAGRAAFRPLTRMIVYNCGDAF